MTRLLQDLQLLRTLREQREQKALRQLEKNRELLKQTQKACELQRNVLDTLRHGRTQLHDRFMLKCDHESVSMAQLDQHRMELEVLARQELAAQQELTLRQKAQTQAETEMEIARKQLLLARKAIDKIDQAKDMVRQIVQEGNQSDLDSQEEEILELHNRFG